MSVEAHYIIFYTVFISLLHENLLMLKSLITLHIPVKNSPLHGHVRLSDSHSSLTPNTVNIQWCENRGLQLLFYSVPLTILQLFENSSKIAIYSHFMTEEPPVLARQRSHLLCVVRAESGQELLVNVYWKHGGGWAEVKTYKTIHTLNTTELFFFKTTQSNFRTTAQEYVIKRTHLWYCIIIYSYNKHQPNIGSYSTLECSVDQQEVLCLWKSPRHTHFPMLISGS